MAVLYRWLLTRFLINIHCRKAMNINDIHSNKQMAAITRLSARLIFSDLEKYDCTCWRLFLKQLPKFTKTSSMSDQL